MIYESFSREECIQKLKDVLARLDEIECFGISVFFKDNTHEMGAHADTADDYYYLSYDLNNLANSCEDEGSRLEENERTDSSGG